MMDQVMLLTKTSVTHYCFIIIPFDPIPDTPLPSPSFPSFPFPSSTISTSLIMTTLSPPPTRHRASSTNLRPALTISTLGPRPKACALLDCIPATPPVTADRKMSPTLASPSRLSVLLEQCWELLRVHSYLLPHSTTPSSPRSPSEDSVLPMSAATTVFGDDTEDEKSSPMKVSSSRPWWWNTPSVCSSLFHSGHTSAYAFTTGSHSHIVCDHYVPSIDRASSP
jgi:hypothetical protein